MLEWILDYIKSLVDKIFCLKDFILPKTFFVKIKCRILQIPHLFYGILFKQLELQLILLSFGLNGGIPWDYGDLHSFIDLHS